MPSKTRSIAHIVKNKCHLVEGVWQFAAAEPFAYSDGQDTEEYLLGVILSCEDISSKSRELESKIVDWPTRYHLSRERCLAYESMQFRPGMRILEVGSGCGSITRFLGETGCEVLAVEASLRRACITRERTRDLGNVEVLSAPFQKIEYQQPFDVLICNGVLEYSATFVDADRPYVAILEHFRRALSPSGCLVIAIENQFGLRYFTSSAEDHNGVLFDGLEGYPRYPKGARTFGSRQLEVLIGRSFEHVEWLLPLCDYKLPTAVIRDSLSARHDISELLVSIPIGEHNAMVQPRFHEKLAWPDIVRNGLVRTFSNSLIAIAHGGDCPLLDSAWFGSVYSLHRHSWFSTKTTFVSIQGGDAIEVHKERWEPEIGTAPDGPLRHLCPTTQPWINGISVRTLVTRLFCQAPGLSLETRLEPIVRAWWAAVDTDSESELIRGSMVDAIWNNALFEREVVTLIDTEWEWKSGVPRSWLLYRAVHRFVDVEIAYAHRWAKDTSRLTEWDILRLIAKICGQRMTRHELYDALILEKQFHHIVSGGNTAAAKSIWTILIIRWTSIKTRQRIENIRRYFLRLLLRIRAHLARR
jgi:precorrin-6B methylase 2